MTKMRKTCFKILQRKISEQLEGKKEKATHIFQLPLISIRRRKNLKKKPSHNIHTTNVDEMRYKRVSYVKYIRIRSNLQESNGHGQKQLIAWQTFEFKSLSFFWLLFVTCKSDRLPSPAGSPADRLCISRFQAAHYRNFGGNRVHRQ
jgi:hypothetical protein